MVNQEALLKTIVKLWEEFSNELDAFSYFEHEEGCPAAPVYWEDPCEQPECICGFAQVERQFFEIDRTIRHAHAKRDKRVRRKTYNLLVESFKSGE